MFLPFISVFVMWYFFKHKTALWEFILPFVLSIILIVIFKAVSVKSQTDAIEYWNGYITNARYYEDWNEYIHQTCTASCGKNCTYTYDCSYVSYHQAYWEMYDKNGIQFSIAQQTYDWIKGKWGGNETFQELNRHYYTKDGNMYHTDWTWNQNNFVYVVTKHHYENRVQASESVFKWRTVTEEDKKNQHLFDYPEIVNNNVASILGDSSAYMQEIDNRQYKWLNASLGKDKQLRLWILLFKGVGEEAFEYQKAYWKNGNKNEFVICIGIDDYYAVNWCNVFSWTEQEELKIRVKNYILDNNQGKLDLDKSAGYIYTELKDNFVRKHFRDFDYLTVEPSTTCFVWAFILVLILNIGCVIFAVKNDIDE